MIDKFSKAQFEQVLFNIHPDFGSLGLDAGEECYTIPVNAHTRLKIRSSIDRSGYAADSGEDSIRLWLEVYQPHWRRGDKMIWNAVSKKVDAYTTRIPGWDKRLQEKVQVLWDRAVKVRQASTCCPCGGGAGVYFTLKMGKNFGRPFQSCRKCGFFEWLDTEPQGKVEFEVIEEDTLPIFDFELGINPNEPVEVEFQPSPYQQAIFYFVKNDTGHGICEACAGSGKTTTNIQAVNYVPAGLDIVFLAFNRHIAQELKERGVQVANTFHALGKAAITASMPTAKFNQYKIYDTCDKIEVGLSYDEKGQIAKIIGLLKGNLLECTSENIETIIDSFPSIGKIDEDDIPGIVRLVKRIYTANEKNSLEYDFDDMIHWPATKKASCQKFDFIFVDEAQDLNKAQISMAELSLNKNGRMLLIGDPHQSIYAFRGAFVGIMDYMKDKLQATNLPLSISYRSSLAVVDYVNKHFPHIPFEPSPFAKQGKIETISRDAFLDNVLVGDGIVCRTNAPLVEPCFQLIRRGIKATILGRDIGKGLVNLINKRSKLARVQKLAEVEKLPALIGELRIYYSNEKIKLEKAQKFNAVQALEDQIETIIAISDDCYNIDELKKKIQNTFSDDSEGIVFSSVHKAKGLEWDRVYILRPDLLPHPMAKTETDRAQEMNIKYVAVTRTKNELYFVKGK